MCIRDSSYSVAVSYDKKPAFFSIHDKYDPYWNMCITTMPEAYLSKADLRFIETLKSTLSGDVPAKRECHKILNDLPYTMMLLNHLF